MGKQGISISSVVEAAPRWLLVILASGGIFLLKERFNSIETSVSQHTKELEELKVISARLAAVVETRRERYDHQ